MTETDIKGNCTAIRHLASQIARADLPSAERETVKVLAEAALVLLEGFLLDINRIAEAAAYACAEYQDRLRR